MLAVAAQAHGVQAQDAQFKLNIDVDLVELHVMVLDEQDRYVPGLTRGDFRVLEDRVEQGITLFKQEDQPVSLGLVIDNSRSMQRGKERMDAGALSFVQHSNPRDETFVLHFDDRLALGQDFTDNVSDLEDAVRGKQPYGQTALYDAILSSLERMRGAKFDKKALLLITDGADNVSTHSFDEALEGVKQSLVSIYSIGVLDQSSRSREAAQELRQLVSVSGGRAYFPETVDEVVEIAGRIARDLRRQYTLGYVPSNLRRDGRWRSVRLQIVTPPNAGRRTAHYRHGYYAPEP